MVTSLDGAVVDGASLRYVGLSQVDPSIDLSEVRVDEESICPDGLPADGEGFSATCAR